MTHVVHDEFGVSHSWGQGREVVFLSNPLADPVSWSGPARGPLVDAGYRVTSPHAQQPAGVGGPA